MARQGSIPGTEGKQDKEINDALEHYYKAMQRRLSAGKKEVDAKKALFEMLEKKGVSAYTDRDHVPPLHASVTEGVAKLKVERLENEVEADDEGEDDAE